MFPSSHLPQFQDNTVALWSESWLILSPVEQQTPLEICFSQGFQRHNLLQEKTIILTGLCRCQILHGTQFKL